jgi:hypothetical protein
LTTFYTVADAKFFLGLVVLLNSLRLTGNEGELVVLDRGLTPDQKERLAPHVRLVEVALDGLDNPTTLKPFPHLVGAEDVVVILDSDMMMTANLADVEASAREGAICLFPDHPSTQSRFFPEWRELFGLRAEPSPRRYMNAGFVAFSADVWPELLGRWWDLCRRIPPPAVFTAVSDQPFWAGDQDALNALLASEIPHASIVELPAYAVSILDVVVDDHATLACSAHGAGQPLLHAAMRPKVWQRDGWKIVRKHAYAELVARVLLADDVTLRLRASELPPWLRPDARGKALLRFLDLANATRGLGSRAARRAVAVACRR